MYPSKSNGPGLCPDCGGTTELKDGRHGLFYGCVEFPYCFGSRNFIVEIKMDNDWKEIISRRLDRLEKKPRRSTKTFWFLVWVLMNVFVIGLIGAAICCAYNWAAATHDESHWATEYPPYMSLYISIPGFFMMALSAIGAFMLGICANDKHGAAL